MAGALIPLVIAGGPLLIELTNLIAGLVHKHAPAIEATRGPGTGPIKITDLVAAVFADLQAAAAGGAIPKDLPADETIKLIIQSVVSSMKLKGELGPVPAVPPVPAAPVAPAPAGTPGDPGTQLSVHLGTGDSVTVSR